MTLEERIPITDESDIVKARQVARQRAVASGFSQMDQSRIATAVSELARNVVRYAFNGKGEVLVREVISDAGQTGIEVEVRDQGPGIPDIERAMTQGFSSGKGLGLGLSGTKRLMDEMKLDSSPNGTTVVIRKWRR